jgi:hypothetical protein
VPGEFGQRVTVTQDNTTLFASDRDMFVFLADEENRIELPSRRAGRSAASLAASSCGTPRWVRPLSGRLLPLRLCLLQPDHLGRRPVHRDPYSPYQRRAGPVARGGYARSARILAGERQTGSPSDRRRAQQARRCQPRPVPRQPLR